MKNNCSGLIKVLGKLLFLAVFSGVVLYFCLSYCGQAISEKFIEHSTFVENQAAKRIENFREYIYENNITAFDSEEIFEWGKRNSIVLMEIYRGHFLLYSTAAPQYFYNGNNKDESVIYEWATYHTVTFADGDAQIIVYTDEMSTVYFWVIIYSAAIGTVFALIIFLYGCNRIIKQICIINNCIQLMEAGDFDVEIPVVGNHELSQLAKSLDSMRSAFKEQRDNEMSIFLAHQTMITEMSHDLRTPLTTLQIYTDILRYKKYEPDMLDKHLEMIDAKARQIKQLADNLFEYSIVSNQHNIELETSVSAYTIFHELIPEYIYKWAHQGFLCDCNSNWPDVLIAGHSIYIKRVMDNISSNLIKNASKEDPIHIKTSLEEEFFCLTIRTKIKNFQAEENNNIGLSNIEIMMKKMNGKSKIFMNEEEFFIALFFPIIEK